MIDAEVGTSAARVRPAGLEPATDGLENRCSIHLSYGRRTGRYSTAFRLTGGERAGAPSRAAPAGFEPATCGLGNRRSIHLSYEREVFLILIFGHEIGSCQSHGTKCRAGDRMRAW